MAQFGLVEDSISHLGARLVLIAAEKREGIFNPERFLTQHPTPFPFLLDEDRRVTKTYGVHHRLGLDAINIAHPATFVIDRDRMVRFAYIGLNQTDRIAVPAVLEILRKL